MYVTLNSALSQADLIIPVTGKQTHIRLTVDRAAILSLTFLRTRGPLLYPPQHGSSAHCAAEGPPQMSTYDTVICTALVHTEVEKNQQTVFGCALDTSTYLPWLSLSYLVLPLHPRGYQDLEVELTVPPLGCM